MLGYLFACSVALAVFQHTAQKNLVWWEKHFLTITLWSKVNTTGKLKFCPIQQTEPEMLNTPTIKELLWWSDQMLLRMVTHLVRDLLQSNSQSKHHQNVAE